MYLEDIVQILIYSHAISGGIAILTGGIAIGSRKGKNLHRKTGKWFYYSMLFSCCIALVVSVLPSHKSPFLFSIGLFSLYFVITGYRSLNYKMPNHQLSVDKWISMLMIAVGLSMIFYPLVSAGKVNIVLSVFGMIGLAFSVRDLLLFKNKERLRKDWLKLHAGKITGAYISATTAFFVVNGVLPGLWAWFIPTVIGTLYISYWMAKLNKNTK